MEELKETAKRRVLTLVAYLFEGYELLDTYGPLEMFATVNMRGVPLVLEGVSKRQQIQIVTVGEGKTAMAPQCLTDYHPGDAGIPRADILLLPGGNAWEVAVEREEVREWLLKAIDQATLVMSVCNGAGFLATLGFLDGRKATTNKIDFPELQSSFPQVNWEQKARWSSDGKFFTSSGVSAGTDLSLFLIEKIFGSEIADQVTHATEFVRITDAANDPFCKNAERDWDVKVVGEKSEIRVGLFLFDNFEMLDVFGPLEMLAVANRFDSRCFRLVTVGSSDRIKSSKGPFFRPDITHLDPAFGESIDVLFVPGGFGTVRESHDKNTLSWLTKVVQDVDQVFTVCTGSSLIAATGALDGKDATTNKLSFNFMTMYGPKVQWKKQARFVCDGRFFTSSGVAAGIDLSLDFIAKHYGMNLARSIAERAEYVWKEGGEDDPFTSDVKETSFKDRVILNASKLSMGALFTAGLGLGFEMKTSKLFPEWV